MGGERVLQGLPAKHRDKHLDRELTDLVRTVHEEHRTLSVR